MFHLQLDRAHFHEAVKKFIDRRLSFEAVEGVSDAAKGVGREVIQNWPVATGESQKGWRKGLREMQATRVGDTGEATVGNRVAHAARVEYGDATAPGHAVVQQALQLTAGRVRIVRRLARGVKKAWRGVP